MADTNEALFRQLLDAWGRGDRDATSRFFADDIVFSYPGAGRLHGEYRGRDGLLRFGADQDRYSAGRFKPDFLDLVGSESNVSRQRRGAPAATVWVVLTRGSRVGHP